MKTHNSRETSTQNSKTCQCSPVIDRQSNHGQHVGDRTQYQGNCHQISQLEIKSGVKEHYEVYRVKYVGSRRNFFSSLADQFES